MQMQDLISKKKNGLSLNEDELRFFIEGYVKDEIPDYQVSALLMAIIFKGMDKKETSLLTNLMMHSGDVCDLSSIKGIKVDKHSTGGVGDKTSLVLGPLVASCGAKLAKMSGRGLGFTGGTLDKLESIPGMSISLSSDEFLDEVDKVGMAIIGQTLNLVPADKKLYALRDVTGTVDSIPLIASSIMSKKLASGSDCILLDVKFGSGAFMKDLKSARKLARTMVEIGHSFSKDTRAIITDMNQPLGKAVGNILEVKEAIDTLNGNGPEDFVELCLSAGSIILQQAHIAKNGIEARKMLKEKLMNKEALNKFKEFVAYQGGDISYIDDPRKFEIAKNIIELKSNKSGYVSSINAIEVGLIAMHLGAGRKTKTDKIDYTAGIVLNKKVGDYVNKGDTLCVVHTNIEDYQTYLDELRNSFIICDTPIGKSKIVFDYIK